MASKKSASKKLKRVEPLSRPPDEKPKPKEKFRTRRTTGARPEVKTKRTTLKPLKNKKQKKEYTEKELGIPQLNGIIPAGVRKPPGKKRGKIFVDDAESMLAILGMVQAEKEGEREGKLMKAVRCSFPFAGQPC
jgi:60S ribosomal subunit assembly/export protein LOC1